MSIVHIHGSRFVAERATPKALANIATHVAEAVGCNVGDVWCTFTPATEMTIGNRPGRILYLDLLARPRATDELQRGLEAAARAASASFGVALEEVWAHLTVLETDRVFAGGELL